MLKLPIDEIIRRINDEEVFSCIALDGSFSLYISEYVPYICAAIHDGGNLRHSLRSRCLLSKSDRWYEEDPLTASFISALPIRIIGNDSRYEYDLNRAPADCVYKEAWGKKIWSEDLETEDIEESLDKHCNFYRVIDALVGKIQKKYKSCVVYDIHSYNYKRITNLEAPMFNVGTANLDKKYRFFIDDWLKRLSKLKSDYFVNQTAENLVFQGHGYFLKHITKKFKNTFVFATEIRKSYCNEDTGDIFPEVVNDLKSGLRRAILDNAKLFIEEKCNISVNKRSHLLTSNIEPVVLSVDAQISKILKAFDFLSFINPSNLEAEKKKFFASKFKKNPEFSYKPLKVDVAKFKKSLYEVPVDSIHDLTLQKIFRSVIEGYCDQIELLAYRGDIKFKYMSLKYFGEPHEGDLTLAKYFLDSPDRENISPLTSDEKAVTVLRNEMKSYGFIGKVELTRNIPSIAAFSPTKKTLKVKKGIKIKKNFLEALCHHEIGVHMLTTENALRQPLRVFETGFPVSTLTQEGLAIASEYCAGLLTIERLKDLSLRVVAVDHMLKVYDFKETFSFLVERYRIDEEKAFYLTARVYRGGGFTKDYLYLRGFRKIKKMIDSGKDITPLLIGKTSYHFYNEIRELLDRGILNKPEFITRSFKEAPKQNDEVLEYLLTSF